MWDKTMKNTQERKIYIGKNQCNHLVYHFIISRDCACLIHRILHYFYAGIHLDENCTPSKKIGLKITRISVLKSFLYNISKFID